MGSGQSKRSAHLSESHRRWLEEQDSETISSLISAARKSQGAAKGAASYSTLSVNESQQQASDPYRPFIPVVVAPKQQQPQYQNGITHQNQKQNYTTTTTTQTQHGNSNSNNNNHAQMSQKLGRQEYDLNWQLGHSLNLGSPTGFSMRGTPQVNDKLPNINNGSALANQSQNNRRRIARPGGYHMVAPMAEQRGQLREAKLSSVVSNGAGGVTSTRATILSSANSNGELAGQAVQMLPYYVTEPDAMPYCLTGSCQNIGLTLGSLSTERSDQNVELNDADSNTSCNSDDDDHGVYSCNRLSDSNNFLAPKQAPYLEFFNTRYEKHQLNNPAKQQQGNNNNNHTITASNNINNNNNNVNYSNPHLNNNHASNAKQQQIYSYSSNLNIITGNNKQPTNHVHPRFQSQQNNNIKSPYREQYHQNHRSRDSNLSLNIHELDLYHQPYLQNQQLTHHQRAPKKPASKQQQHISKINNNNNNNITMTQQMTNINNCPQLTRSHLALGEQRRHQLNMTGLLPNSEQNSDLLVKWVLHCLDKLCANSGLVKYQFLRNLKDNNEDLFYMTLMQNVEILMPIVYTPVVGEACQNYSSLYDKQRGLFIGLKDSGSIERVLENCCQKDVRVIVVTDGERILGLGDLGANGMGICIGKLSLYTALAGVPPRNVLPVTLDTGTNNEQLLADPFYIGSRERRTRSSKYDELIDEFMRSVVNRWGRSCLIQFEDFGNANAFRLLQRYQPAYCTFNDDIQGTASVCLAGLLSASKMVNRPLLESRFLFYGAGEANLGTAKLLAMAMCEQGARLEEAKSRIWLVDSKGLVVSSRTDLSEHKRVYAQDIEKDIQKLDKSLEKLEDIVDFVKPSAIIGASAQGGAFNEHVCRSMAKANERPIIFALSNPTSKAECTAQQAYEWTQGKCVFASGSPFEPVDYDGKRHVTGQGNNAYIFPAVGLAAIAAHMHMIPEESFLVAAQALSELLSRADVAVGLVYPPLGRLRECTLKVAARLLEFFYSERLATFRPEPSDKLSFLRSLQYAPSLS